MRLVLHTFCGLPLRGGAVLIGTFTSVVCCAALADLIKSLTLDDYQGIFTTREDWLDYMSVKTSIVFLLTLVSFMQFVGGFKQSQALIIPFLICGSFLVGGMLCDQAISAIVGIGSIREFRGVVSPAITILFFVWIDISYIYELKRKYLESVKSDVMLP